MRGRAPGPVTPDRHGGASRGDRPAAGAHPRARCRPPGSRPRGSGADPLRLGGRPGLDRGRRDRAARARSGAVRLPRRAHIAAARPGARPTDRSSGRSAPEQAGPAAESRSRTGARRRSKSLPAGTGGIGTRSAPACSGRAILRCGWRRSGRAGRERGLRRARGMSGTIRRDRSIPDLHIGCADRHAGLRRRSRPGVRPDSTGQPQSSGR